MSRSLKRLMVYMVVAAGGLSLFQSNAGFCRFQSTRLLTSIDWCFIFDCQNGLLGGIFQPCNPDDLLQDCP